MPFTIGTRDLWANALWFDYLTKRINGLDFYMGLMDGKESYTDPRLKKVFDTWRVPIEKGYFLDNASSYGWQEAIPFLSQGKAAMYLLGPYVLTSLPEDARKNIGFFPFPTVDPAVPNFEQVSINGVGIPKGAKNKELALKFLAFLAQPANLEAFAKEAPVVPARTDIAIDKNGLCLGADGAGAQFGRILAVLRPRHRPGDGAGGHEGLPGIPGPAGPRGRDPRAA